MALFAFFCRIEAQVFSENFDGGVPGGMTQTYITGTVDWTNCGGNTGGATCPYNGTGSAHFYESAYSGNQTSLETSVMDLSAGGYQLRFSHVQPNWSGDQNTLLVEISTDGGTSWTTMVNYTSDISAWVDETILLDPYTTTATTIVRFTGTINYGYAIGLDDVVVESAPSCPAPSAQTESNITSSSADLGWTENGSATMWNIEYGPTGFTQGNGTTVAVSSNPYTLSGLMSNTTYDWYVQSDCGGSGTSAWVGPSMFTTPPVNDNCSGAVSLTVGNSGDCPTNQVTSDASSATADGNTSCDALGDNIGVWYSFVAPASGEVVVKYTAGTATGDPGIVLFDACGGTEIAGTCQNNPATLSNITGLTGGTTYYMLLWFDGASAAGTFDICLEDIPACSPAPSGQSEANISQTSVDLSWTDNAGASNWNIEYGPTGFTQGSGTTVPVSSNPYTLSGLSANTTYDWYVQSDCGGGNGTSNWVGPSTFTTALAPLSNPTSCGINLSIPDNGCSTSNYLEVPIQVSGAPGTQLGTDVILSTVSIIIVHTYDADLDIYLESPNGVSVELSTDNGSSGDNYGDSANCPTDVTTFDMGASGSITAGSAPFVGSYKPEGDFNSFNDGSDPNGVWKLRVCDDASGDVGTVEYVKLVLTTPPSCPDPSTQTESNITSSSADLGWTENGSATMWNIEYGPTGFTQGNGTTVAVSSNPYTLSGLMSNTTYDWYVQSDCGGSGTSAWVGPSTFTTLCGAFSIPYSNDFSANADCWTVLDANGDGSTWSRSSSCNGQGLRATYNGSNAMDDWAFSPDFTLTGGTEYKVSFSSGNNSTTYIEKLEVFLMDGTDPATATKVLLYRDMDITDGTCYPSDIFVSAPAGWSGYYVGFHGYSDADQYYLYVDDFSIDVAPAVSTLTPENNNANTCDSYTVNGVAGSNWHHIYNGGNIVASINANGQDLGTVFVEMRDNGTAIEKAEDTGAPGTLRKIMPKYFNFDADNVFANPVTVRLYYTDTELNDFNAFNPVSSHTVSDLDVTHYDGTFENCSIDDNTSGTSTLIDNASISNTAVSSGFYLQFDVSSFSEIFAHEPSLGALPVELLSFTAKAHQKVNVITWSTASEANSKWMVIERSKDGSRNWQEIDRVSGHQNSTVVNNYEVIDENPLEKSFYRIHFIDNDGKEEYSSIRMVVRENTLDEVVGVRPIPAKSEVFITMRSTISTTVNIEIYDISGRVVQSTNREITPGTTDVKIDLSSLSEGLYIARISGVKISKTISIVKE